nr:hypothetical protein [Tanacetum cinerariifolium]
DTSKQWRIDAIDADEEITLVSVQDEVVRNDADKEMFDVDVLNGDKMFVAEHKVAVKRVNDEVNAKIDVDHSLAERMQAQEQEELSIIEKDTLFQQLLKNRRKHFASKRAEEKRNKPPTKAQ